MTGRTGRRIAPADVYHILKKWKDDGRPMDEWITQASREIAELSHVEVAEHEQVVLDYQANYYNALSPDR